MVIIYFKLDFYLDFRNILILKLHGLYLRFM